MARENWVCPSMSPLDWDLTSQSIICRNNVGTNAGTRVLLLASQPSNVNGNPRDTVKISAAFTYLTVNIDSGL
jgi:hypothetical protein